MRVLYVAQNDLNSSIAVDLAAQAEQGLIDQVQYVEELGEAIPPWLTGVPTLASTTGEMMQGADCIRFLGRSRRRSAPTTVPTAAAPPATAPTAVAAEEVATLDFDPVLPDVEEPPSNSEKGVDMNAVKRALAERGIS